MKITKKSFVYGLKASINYSSVNLQESIECELGEESVEDLKSFEDMKTEVRNRVRTELESEIVRLTPVVAKKEPEKIKLVM